MLEKYFRDPRAISRARSGLAGPHVDDFVRWLDEAGYTEATVRHYTSATRRFAKWASGEGLSVSDLNGATALRYGEAIAGNCSNSLPGARAFARYLETAGIVAAKPRDEPSLPHIVREFSDWLRFQRGVNEITNAEYLPPIRDFVGEFGSDASTYTPQAVCDFVSVRGKERPLGHVKKVVRSLRMFLRFLSSSGQCSPDLVAVVPTIAEWRLARLPRFVSCEVVERIIAACDRTPNTVQSIRDRAIILLLARLGLRAGDVVRLRMDDIDWLSARLRVAGKGRCEDWLPLLQEVGDAVLDYLKVRPAVHHEQVFLRIPAPAKPFSTPCAIWYIVKRAIQRAGVEAPCHGAHLLRHSLATNLLKQGATLEEIRSVLRHRSIQTTTIYAKADLPLLHQVVQPWPGHEEESAC